MMKRAEQVFLEKYIVKSGEELSLVTPPSTDAFFYDIQLIKRTERTFRVVGLLTISNEESDSGVADEELLKAKLTPTKKLHWHDHDPNTIRWFEQGWIIKEIRFKKDGRTPDTQHYRMGYRLYSYLQKLEQTKVQELDTELNQIRASFGELNEAPTHSSSGQREKGINSVIMFINELLDMDATGLQISDLLPRSWPINKRLKFLHFTVAFLKVSRKKWAFDWKEIGASYYKVIGGSKEFDQHKEEFIELLEEGAQAPAAVLGLTSLGKITPLYFSGPITGQFSSYSYGPVHAVTDLSISQERYTTSATNLWLVENRAILTRIASEQHFLEETRSLLLCLDGHLRSSHKRCLFQLLSNSSIKQAIIWTDYDPDGLQIAKEIYETVIETEMKLTMKWISAEHEVLHSWQDYQDYMVALLKIKKMEQEEVLGGAEAWRKWVHR